MTTLYHMPTGSIGKLLRRAELIPKASIVTVIKAEAGCHHKKGDGHIWDDDEVSIIPEKAS